MKNYFIILLSLTFWGCASSGVEEYDGTPPASGEEDEVTVWMDSYLSTHYLYNDSYNALTRDLTTPWDDYLDATLTQLGGNLDYKYSYDYYYETWGWDYYSYIYQSSTSTYGSTMRASGNYTLSFGLYYAILSDYTYSRSTYYRIAIGAVYPDSPLSEYAERGDFITHVNEQRISSSDDALYYAYALLYAGYGATSYELTFDDGTTETVTAAYIDPTPILKSEVIYEEGEHKVGYLHYASFDIDYDEDLYTELKSLKTAGITELILDMRFNGGGYVYSSNMLSSIIAGSAGQGEVFNKYIYNSSRGSESDNFMTTYTYNSKIGSISDAFLGFDKIYCVVSSYTASASELVINSLEGIDIEVYLAGSDATTEGKNVGMEVKTTTVGSYTYEFAPITFRSENAKGDGDYEDGFDVDYEASDWDSFSDFTADEVLISAALTHITTGNWPAAVKSVSTTTAESKTKGTTLFAPSRKCGNLVPLLDNSPVDDVP